VLYKLWYKVIVFGRARHLRRSLDVNRNINRKINILQYCTLWAYAGWRDPQVLWRQLCVSFHMQITQMAEKANESRVVVNVPSRPKVRSPPLKAHGSSTRRWINETKCQKFAVLCAKACWVSMNQSTRKASHSFSQVLEVVVHQI